MHELRMVGYAQQAHSRAMRSGVPILENEADLVFVICCLFFLPKVILQEIT